MEYDLVSYFGPHESKKLKIRQKRRVKKIFIVEVVRVFSLFWDLMIRERERLLLLNIENYQHFWSFIISLVRKTSLRGLT